MLPRRRYLAKEMTANPVLPVFGQMPPPGAKPVRRPSPSSVPLAPHTLQSYYDAMFRAHGSQHWWPGRTRFEVIVGAILTQNTSWTNVERAIHNLRQQKLLSPAAMARVSPARLARLIRSSGYFRQKARKLKAFVRFLGDVHHGSLTKMFRTPTTILREQLLSVHGIGPETADSILLYAGKHLVFVVDAYTRRILERHNLASGKESYDEIRDLFQRNLPSSAALFNEYHALIVHTGKHCCRARAPLCEACALQPFLPPPPEVPL